MAYPLSGRLAAHRVGIPKEYPLYSGMGAQLYGARWNSPGQPAIYASLSYGTALLELSVHLNGMPIPSTLRRIEIDIPPRVSRHPLSVNTAPGWQSQTTKSTQSIGDNWLASQQSAVLIVPSVIAPLDWNIVINPLHPDVRYISYGAEMPVVTDPRLQAIGTATAKSNPKKKTNLQKGRAS